MSTQGIRNATHRIRSGKTTDEKFDAIADAFKELADALTKIERDISARKSSYSLVSAQWCIL
jgi:hypothetical protein